MNTPQPSSHDRRLPYLLAATCFIGTYPVIWWISDRQSLAFAFGAVATVSGFLICRVIQMRGRMTLAMAVLGVPFLVAMVFAAALHLAPFAERQKACERLDRAGIGYLGSEPERLGEWTQDIRGNTLPTWIANWIGPNAMSEIQSIDGRLRDLQRVNLGSFATPDLKSLAIHWDDSGSDLSTDFVNWVQSSDLEYLRVTHQDSISEDASEPLEQSIGFLNSTKRARASSSRGSNLRTVLELRGGSHLADASAKTLAEIPHGSTIRLANLTIDINSLQSLASRELENVWLRDVKVPNLALVPKTPPVNGVVRELRILENRLAMDEIRALLRIFNCKTLITETDATETDIESLWSYDTLQEIRTWDGVSPRHRIWSRPTPLSTSRTMVTK